MDLKDPPSMPKTVMTTATTEPLCSLDINPSSAVPGYVAKLKRIELLTCLLLQQKISGGLYICGSAGTGKTTTVMRCVEEEALTGRVDVTLVRGQVTASAMYAKLYEATTTATRSGKQSVLVFDDADDAVSAAPNLIKACLETTDHKVVSYLSSRPPAGIPTSFEFKGVSVIIISNISLSGSRSPDMEAIKSRLHYVEIYLTKRETLHFIATKVAKEPYRESTAADRSYVVAALSSSALATAQPITVRIYRQLLDLYLANNDQFQMHLDQMLPPSVDLQLLRDALSAGETIDDAAELWMLATGKSKRAFYYTKQRYGHLI